LRNAAVAVMVVAAADFTAAEWVVADSAAAAWGAGSAVVAWADFAVVALGAFAVVDSVGMASAGMPSEVSS